MHIGLHVGRTALEASVLRAECIYPSVLPQPLAGCGGTWEKFTACPNVLTGHGNAGLRRKYKAFPRWYDRLIRSHGYAPSRAATTSAEATAASIPAPWKAEPVT